MRALPLLLAALLAGCGDPPPPPPPSSAGSGPGGFLRWLPDDVAVTVRLPPARLVAEHPDRIAPLLRLFGVAGDPPAALFGAAEPAGLSPDAAGGLAVTPDGAWVRYLPATDRAALNRSLRPLPRELTLQEKEEWVVVASGGRGLGTFEGEPLPAGDLGLRVRHHGLLALLASPTDVLELGVRLGGGGLEARGVLTPGPDSPTRATLADARPGSGDLLDYIPSAVGIRIETTLPPVSLASLLARRLARHAGFAEEADAVVAERFLRELLTGLAQEPGIAIGVEFDAGQATVVVLGRRAPGPDSPILAKVRREPRSVFGALVLDAREAPDGVTGLDLWIAQAEPVLEGLPECLWPAASGLVHENEGLDVAYATHDDWCVLAAGPRADLLARAVRAKVARGPSRSFGSFELMNLRTAVDDADYVLGAVLVGPGLAELPPADRDALRGLFFAGEAASPPETIALAAFRDGPGVRLRARLRY